MSFRFWDHRSDTFQGYNRFGTLTLNFGPIFEDRNLKLRPLMTVAFKIMCTQFGANWIMRSHVTHIIVLFHLLRAVTHAYCKLR